MFSHPLLHWIPMNLERWVGIISTLQMKKKNMEALVKLQDFPELIQSGCREPMIPSSDLLHALSQVIDRYLCIASDS